MPDLCAELPGKALMLVRQLRGKVLRKARLLLCQLLAFQVTADLCTELGGKALILVGQLLVEPALPTLYFVKKITLPFLHRLLELDEPCVKCATHTSAGLPFQGITDLCTELPGKTLVLVRQLRGKALGMACLLLCQLLHV